MDLKHYCPCLEPQFGMLKNIAQAYPSPDICRRATHALARRTMKDPWCMTPRGRTDTVFVTIKCVCPARMVAWGQRAPPHPAPGWTPGT